MTRREQIERESFTRTVLDSLAAHTAVIDRDGVITEVNTSWREFSVRNGGEERSCGVAVDYLAVCDAAARHGLAGAADVAAGIRAVLDGRVASYQQDYECPSPDERRWFAMEVDPLPGRQGGALVFHVPVTRLKQQAAALEHLALHDELTGLPNRARFSQALDRALRGDGSSGHIAVLICDLDDFKVVNDSLGHAAGDEVLIEVGRRLRQNTRSDDMIARLGGDEFAIMLQVTSDEEIDRSARRLSDSLREPVTLSTTEQVRHGSSIGIAVASAEADASSLLRDADAAMYRAKELGRRRIHRFDHQLREEAVQRLALQHDLLGALQRDEFFCHYQPEVELATGQLFGFESLARWVHPTRGPLSPARFVPIIERLGEATTLFDHVLSQTLTAAQLWHERSGAWPTMAINLSAQQLGDPSLLGSVAEGIHRTGIEPSRLWLEVTETAVADVTSLKTFERLHDLGVRLAIDDFGTGYSSMARIAGFGWDACKIDRSFVEKLGTGARSIHVVEAIIAMAHSLDMLVIAEGVETAEQLARLAELGCDIAQGYLIARPAPLESFREEVSTSRHWRNWDRLRAPMSVVPGAELGGGHRGVWEAGPGGSVTAHARGEDRDPSGRRHPVRADGPPPRRPARPAPRRTTCPPTGATHRDQTRTPPPLRPSPTSPTGCSTTRRSLATSRASTCGR